MENATAMVEPIVIGFRNKLTLCVEDGGGPIATAEPTILTEVASIIRVRRMGNAVFLRFTALDLKLT
jgi:hypothetical protein